QTCALPIYQHFLVRRLRARERIPDRGIVKAERADQAEREKSSAVVFAPLQPERRRARRAGHVHLHTDQRGSRADKQLVGSGGYLFEVIWTTEWRDARAHNVCC